MKISPYRVKPLKLESVSDRALDDIENLLRYRFGRQPIHVFKQPYLVEALQTIHSIIEQYRELEE
jgi:hypothetical protein